MHSQSALTLLKRAWTRKARIVDLGSILPGLANRDGAVVGEVTHKLNVDGNYQLEIYDYPGGYAQRFNGIDRNGAPRGRRTVAGPAEHFCLSRLSVYERLFVLSCKSLIQKFGSSWGNRRESRTPKHLIGMSRFLCTACGIQYPESNAPPSRCIICEDPRQFVPSAGQGWTTREKIAVDHFNAFREVATGLFGLSTMPRFRLANGL
jgi:hypothetical protein